MKKLTLLFVTILTLTLTGKSQDEVIAGWTFPADSLTADTGLLMNLYSPIITLGSTSDIELKNGYETKAAQASSWDLGMGDKAWMVIFSTMGYSNITVSSRQQSGGTDPGPRDWQIEYSVDLGITWNPVAGGEVTVENDWETSFVDHLALPNDCNDQVIVELRWIMTTNVASGSGGAVQANGKSKIDDIFIRGDKVNGINDHKFTDVRVGPNPASDELAVKAGQNLGKIGLVDMSGKTVLSKTVSASETTLDISDLPQGIYFLTIGDQAIENSYRQRIIKVD